MNELPETRASMAGVERASGWDLDAELPLPLHAQVTNNIRARITSGAWQAHYRMQPEPELAAALQISRGTLRRSISTLVADGLLVRIRGRGTFVTSTILEPAIAQKLTTLSEDFAAQKVKWRTETLEGAIVQPPASVASLLDIENDKTVFRLTRIGLADGGPAAYLINYVRTDLAPAIDQIDFSSHSLFGTLEHDFGLAISNGRRTFSAIQAPQKVANALGVAVGAPVQYLEQITYLADGTPAEYSDIWIDSNKLRVTSMLKRN